MRFILFLLVGMPLLSFASTISYWGGKDGTRHSSGLDACKSYGSSLTFVSESPTSGRCMLGSTFIIGVSQVTSSCQYGNTGLFCNASCDAPNTMVNGQCVAPTAPGGAECGIDPHTNLPKITNASGQCVGILDADQPSQCKYMDGRVRQVRVDVQHGSDGVPVGPASISSFGCAATPVGPNPYKNCKAPAPRESCFNGVCVSLGAAPSACSITAQFTGEVGQGDFGFQGTPTDNGICPPDTDCTPVTPPVVTDSQPCTYVTDSEGRQTCRSFDYQGVPGVSSDCGYVNLGNGDVFRCIARQNPTSKGDQIDTVVTTKTNADGTTTTTKTDTHNRVICSGPNSCTTQTTTNKSVTIKGSDGSVISSTGQCTGPNCSTDGTGGINNGGKGDGDGKCKGDDCSDSGTVAGIPGAPELEDSAEIGESTDGYFNRIASAPIVSAVTSLVIPTGGSCPVYSRQTMIGTFDTAAFCNLAPEILGGLRFLFLALWAWAAVRLFMTA